MSHEAKTVDPIMLAAQEHGTASTQSAQNTIQLASRIRQHGLGITDHAEKQTEKEILVDKQATHHASCTRAASSSTKQRMMEWKPRARECVPAVRPAGNQVSVLCRAIQLPPPIPAWVARRVQRPGARFPAVTRSTLAASRGSEPATASRAWLSFIPPPAPRTRTRNTHRAPGTRKSVRRCGPPTESI